jgi:hypothetical protein
MLGRRVRVDDLRLLLAVVGLLRRLRWRRGARVGGVHLDGGWLGRRFRRGQQLGRVGRVVPVDGAVAAQVRLARLRVDQQTARRHALHARHRPHERGTREVLLQVRRHVHRAVRQQRRGRRRRRR